MRAAFSRLPKIALHACIWLKWFSVPTLLSVGLFFSQIWARSQHAAPSARHRSETSHCPQVQNYGATPEHLDPTQFGQLAGTDSLPDSRCHHPQTWLTFYLQTELTAFLGAVDFNGHFHVFSRSPLGKPRAWRISCFRQRSVQALCHFTGSAVHPAPLEGSHRPLGTQVARASTHGLGEAAVVPKR